MHPDSRNAELKAKLADIELQIHNAAAYLGGALSESEFNETLARLRTLISRMGEIARELTGNFDCAG
jgi:hypothetical protein